MTSVTTDIINGINAETPIKAPVTLKSTGNLTLSGEQTIDGSTTNETRILVASQTDTTENGIYKTASGTWSREKDFDGARDVKTGTLVFVVSGTVATKQLWYVSEPGDPTPGSSMAFTQLPVASSTTNGTMASQNANNVAITGGSIAGITDITVPDGGTGASSFTNDAVLIGNSTNAITASPVTISTLGAMANYKSTIVTSTATAITLATTHEGKTLRTTAGAAVSLTLPNNLKVGHVTKLVQSGTGQVTCSASTGATLQNRQSHTKTAGQHAAIVLEVITQSTANNAATYNMAGDSAS